MSFNLNAIETSFVSDSALGLDCNLPILPLISAEETIKIFKERTPSLPAPPPLSPPRSVVRKKLSEQDRAIKNQFIALFQTFPLKRYPHRTQTMVIEAVNFKFHISLIKACNIYKEADTSRAIKKQKLDKVIEDRFLTLYEARRKKIETPTSMAIEKARRNEQILQALDHLEKTNPGYYSAYYHKIIGKQFQLSPATIRWVELTNKKPETIPNSTVAKYRRAVDPLERKIIAGQFFALQKAFPGYTQALYKTSLANSFPNADGTKRTFSKIDYFMRYKQGRPYPKLLDGVKKHFEIALQENPEESHKTPRKRRKYK